MWVLNNWKLLISFLAGFAVAWLIHMQTVHWAELKHEKALAAQVKADREICESSKRITSNVEQNYESQIATLSADLQRLRNTPTKCVPVARTASKSDGATSTKKPGNADGGITDIRLYEFAGECEQDRLKVIGLQDFIKQTWEAND